MCKIMNWLLFCALAICGIRDVKKREIPIWWLISMSLVVMVFIVVFDRTEFVSRFIGAVIGVFFFLISKCTKEAIGYGDSWLILILGSYLGGIETIQVLFLATMIAAIAAIAILCKKGWKRSITLPFAPYLALAFLGVVCI